jgi:large subunit ribosomal protein L21
MPDTTTSPAAASPAPAGAELGTYAIVEASGQQFWLQPNRYVDIDRVDAQEGDTITLDNVLLLRDGSGTTIGQPYVQGASVQLEVLAHRRGPKIIVYKMRPKKKTRRKNGHRQELTRVKVTAITVAGKASA